MREIRTVPPSGCFLGSGSSGLLRTDWKAAFVTTATGQTRWAQPQLWPQHCPQRRAGLSVRLVWSPEQQISHPRASIGLQTAVALVARPRMQREEEQSGQGFRQLSCPCRSGHHPQLEDKTCSSDALEDASSSGAREAAANEAKERGRGKRKERE